MPGLIDVTTGLEDGSGLIWLDGGLGDDGLSDPSQPSALMTTEDGNHMITETGDPMITE